MPPKLKLFKNKSLPKHQESFSESQSNSSSIGVHSNEQFEIELCWCIQQLQKALGSGKLNSKQVQDHTKSLNVLMSSTAPIVRKRQVMRLSFGDYREKMAIEEKKILKNASKMSLKPATASKKTVFIKKSPFASNIDNNFKFNFNLEDADNVNDFQKSKSVNSESFHFTPSNNIFRFDFNVEI